MREKKFRALVTLQPFRQRPAVPVQWHAHHYQAVFEVAAPSSGFLASAQSATSFAAQSLPTSRIWKECGIIGGRGPRINAGGPPAAGGPPDGGAAAGGAGVGP